MIFGIGILAFSAFLLLLDYSHVYLAKGRKISFLAQVFIWVLLFSVYGKSIFKDVPLYTQGGLKVDLLTFLFLSREAILARIGRSESTMSLTHGVREQALTEMKKIPKISQTAKINLDLFSGQVRDISFEKGL